MLAAISWCRGYLERNAAMPDFPIHNETEYSLTAAMLDQIKRDALEYFGESVRSIKVQYGIERHAFNAKTGEMRYAFSPGDFGLIDMKVSFPDTYHSPRDVRSIDDEEEEVDEVAFDEVDVEEAEEEIEAPAFERFDEEIEDVDDEEEPDFEVADDDFEDLEEDDKEFLYDDDEYE
jgi:hypothetical protein